MNTIVSPREAQVNQNEQKSTPQSKGTAVINEFVGTIGANLTNIHPWIEEDVESFKECPLEDMLRDLLAECLHTPESVNKNVLFSQCLESVLPICNGKKNLGNVKSAEIRQCLRKYAKTLDQEKEQKLYPLFVKATNTALLLLQDTEIQGVRSLRDIPSLICFHVNDPAILTHNYQGQISQRKPDVVVVSKETTHRTHDPDSVNDPNRYTLRHLFLKVAAERPVNSFIWRDIRMFCEFKKKVKSKMNRPPSSYRICQYTLPPQPYLRLQATSTSHASAGIDDPRADAQLSLPDPGAPTQASAGPTSGRGAPAQAPAGQQVIADSTQSNLNLPSLSGIQAFTGHRQVSPNTQPNPNPPEHIPQSSLKVLQGALFRNSKGVKRTSENLPESHSKRHKKTEHTKDYSSVVQAGCYSTEMFTSHIGRLHALGLVIVGDVLYLWRYDRQGAIQCSGLNFIQDLPRFLVLLLAMQRLQNNQWGLNPNIDPDFGPRPPLHSQTFQEDSGNITNITFDLQDEHRLIHFGLKGRGTNILSVKSNMISEDGSKDLIAKILWSETTRQGEPDILNQVYQIAASCPEVNEHVPEMLWYRRFAETSTAAIRERLGLNPRGSRILYVIVFRRLRPLAELTGTDFVLVLKQIVKCHRTLWREGIYHRDISPSNLMYFNRGKEHVGVLNDFDLASTSTIPTAGIERTGTLPFMAKELRKTQGLLGRIKHTYRHDAESFVWAWTWMTLRCEEGKPSSKNENLDEDWLDLGKRSGFLHHWDNVEAGKGHEQNWLSVRKCLLALLAMDEENLTHYEQTGTYKQWQDDEAYERLLKGPLDAALHIH